MFSESTILLRAILLLLFTFSTQIDVAAQATDIENPAPKAFGGEDWYKKIRIRGYAQLRYNGLFETNPDLTCQQCDPAWGDGGGFSLRRVRIIFFGQIHERVYFYVQPDFASGAGGSSTNFGQLRDAYIDVGLDKDNEFRFRLGQSKVPYGFENMQSSSNRLPLDRNDGINSAKKNERDHGIFFYWAPKKIRKRFSMFNKKGLKGSGDYGVFGLGLYNGQTANQFELNGEPHVVARLAYPFKLGNQYFEPGIQAYTGKYEIAANKITPGVGHNPDRNYLDQRVAVSTILYPRPFGIQAEYNIGRGPEYDHATNSIQVKDLHGGYVTLNYLFEFKGQKLYPFTRLQHYQGGKKHELDARTYNVNELEVGIEWMPYPNFEIVAMYTFSERRYEDAVRLDNFQTGNLMRFQFQVFF
ncbi:MAG: porin [Brumimicrobium sp.]